MPDWAVTAVVALASSALASSGLWSFLSKRNSTQSAMVRLLLGLAYDKIVTQGMLYIDRGWLTKDEYEEFSKHLYEPYVACGGNGVAAQIMDQVRHLPLRSLPRYVEIASGRSGERDQSHAQ